MDFKQAILKRQSVRSFKPEQITDNMLKTLLEAACAAPVSGGMYDSVHLTVIQEKRLLDEMTAAAAKMFGNPDAKPFYGAPTLILISAKKGDAAANYMAAANASFIAENIAIAAAGLELGSVHLWGFIPSLDPGLVNLPEDFRPVCAVGVGYPAVPVVQREATTAKIAIDYIR